VGPELEFDTDFTQFVAAHQQALHRTAYLLVGNTAGAQDIVQTALTGVYQAWDRRDAWDSPLAYARKAVVNTVSTSMRRRWWGEVATEVLPETASTRSTHEEVDDRDALRRLLASLPARQRTAVVLRYYLDLSEEETARAMDCAVGTVKSATARGLAALRSGLSEVTP